MPATKPPSTGGNAPLEREAGVDWFRAIVEERSSASRARDFASVLHEEDVARGENRKPWSFQGYEGWRTPRLRWGLRGHRLLWETSSGAAPDMWRSLASFTSRTTRLDLQTTLVFSRAQPLFGRRCLRLSRSTGPIRTPLRIPIGLQQSSTGLWCGTGGKRTSERYWRLYDKGVESGSAPTATKWRLELEAKGRLALGLTEELCGAQNEPKWCYERVVSSWKSEGFSWPVPGRPPTLGGVVKPGKPPESRERLAAWLSRSVAPTMPRALRTFTVEELLALLGLSEHAEPRRDEPTGLDQLRDDPA